MRPRRRALAFGGLALGVVIALAATAITIATGRSGREGVVFTRAAKLKVARGAVAGGLALDGSALVSSRPGVRRSLAAIGGGDEVIAPLTGSAPPGARAGG